MRTSRLEGAQRSPASRHSWDTYASQLATKFPEIAAHTCSQYTPNVELRIAWALQQVLPGQSGPEIRNCSWQLLSNLASPRLPTDLPAGGYGCAAYGI